MSSLTQLLQAYEQDPTLAPIVADYWEEHAVPGYEHVRTWSTGERVPWYELFVLLDEERQVRLAVGLSRDYLEGSTSWTLDADARSVWDVLTTAEQRVQEHPHEDWRAVEQGLVSGDGMPRNRAAAAFAALASRLVHPDSYRAETATEHIRAVFGEHSVRLSDHRRVVRLVMDEIASEFDARESRSATIVTGTRPPRHVELADVSPTRRAERARAWNHQVGCAGLLWFFLAPPIVVSFCSIEFLEEYDILLMLAWGGVFLCVPFAKKRVPGEA